MTDVDPVFIGPKHAMLLIRLRPQCSRHWILINQLQSQLPYKLYLKGHYGDESPDVSAGIKSSSILVYDEDGAQGIEHGP
jgi:hypothetical protein